MVLAESLMSLVVPEIKYDPLNRIFSQCKGENISFQAMQVAGKGGKGMVAFRLFPNTPLKYMTTAYSSQP